ncbi:MAG TPA: hypothetical protein VGR26_08010 [Acidimicrobiales bacterium]|nr:hypothetical protein [Acidimicrobiales bacterium]
MLEADAFEKEEKLHDLIEEAPHLMPLAGAPRIVVLGREVTCGSGSADLLAIEDAGRPVVIEIKLAQNPEARRAVVAQVLSYASFLKGPVGGRARRAACTASRQARLDGRDGRRVRGAVRPDDVLRRGGVPLLA